jgi:hypothetical protein
MILDVLPSHCRWIKQLSGFGQRVAKNQNLARFQQRGCMAITPCRHMGTLLPIAGSGVVPDSLERICAGQ